MKLKKKKSSKWLKKFKKKKKKNTNFHNNLINQMDYSPINSPNPAMSTPQTERKWVMDRGEDESLLSEFKKLELKGFLKPEPLLAVRFFLKSQITNALG
jgi:hypothetical protein